tara:strand:- start:2825 stop:3547 length:723 start_codon:yes stop_codon:yes gene_type:complete
MDHYNTDDSIKNIIKCQATIRKTMYNKKRLPNSILMMQKILKEDNIKICKKHSDGRTNSIEDETPIIEILSSKMNNRIKKARDRWWFDMKVFDFRYGWLPVNIKSTTTLTSDNIGNLALCVHAYTDKQLKLNRKYQNGDMTDVLLKKIKKKRYNLIDKKDYYFLIVNKGNSRDIIVNSIKGLTKLTKNVNNLPFQVKWNDNRQFNYKSIDKNIKLLLNVLQNTKPSWKERLMTGIREIES